MTTETFSISPHTYMRELALAWLSRHWFVAALPLAAVTLWAVYDLRAIYVGLILAFLVFPMALSMMWFNYAFSSAALKAVSPKQLSFEDNCIWVDYINGEERRISFEPETIHRQDIVAVEFRSKIVTVVFGRDIDMRLIIDRSALSDEMLSVLQSYSLISEGTIDAF